MNFKTHPPRWQPDAIPSIKGWHHPKTGELLVAIRGIDLEAFAKTDDDDVKEIVPGVIAAPVETQAPAAEAPKKRTWSRRKKVVTLEAEQ